MAMAIYPYVFTNVSTSITASVAWYSAGTLPIYPQGSGYYEQSPPAVPRFFDVPAPVKLLAGRSYKMPDGSRVILDTQGGFRVDDSKAKVLYQANRVRDFNPFMNASDLLEEYINELAPLGVRQDQVLNLAIEHFICWLVHKTAERDSDPVPVGVPKLPPIEAFAIQRRCRSCGRFIKVAFVKAQIYFCSPAHMQRKLENL